MAQIKILYPKIKNPLAMQEMQETVLNPVSGRSPREGNGNPLQYSCLGNPMDREAWRGYHPWDRKESDKTERLN